MERKAKKKKFSFSKKRAVVVKEDYTPIKCPRNFPVTVVDDNGEKSKDVNKSCERSPRKARPVQKDEDMTLNRTITDWIRNGDRPRSVRCPVCNEKVLYSDINNHLDSSCKGAQLMSNVLVNRMTVGDSDAFEDSTETKSETLNSMFLDGKSTICSTKSTSQITGPKTEYVGRNNDEAFNPCKESGITTQENTDLQAVIPVESSTDVLDPYYLANFKLVLDTVLSNEEDKCLFNEADLKVIEQFGCLPIECQKLYIRLFQRKPGWFRCCKLDYPKIAKDLNPPLHTLCNVGFLQNEERLTDLREGLKLLSAGDLKDVGKALHILNNKVLQQKGHTKSHTIEAIIRHGETQRTLFGNGSAIILKRAKSVLGSCVCLISEPKSVFLRVLLLFTMNIIPEDDENKTKYNGQAQQLSTIFLSNIGKLVYPEYTIYREARIFANRDHLIRFAEAYQEKHEMSNALEVSGDLDLAYSYYPKAAQCYKAVLAELEVNEEKPFSARLPVHLRCFTSEWVYTKMCYLGVEVLQKMRRYDEAVEQLKLLLQQNVYCADCRGNWWERLTLNMHQHLKQPVQALHLSKSGLQDPFVRFGRRLALVQRTKKILSSKSFNKNKDVEECRIEESLLEEPNAPESITIQGKRSEELAVFISHEVTKTGEIKEDTMTFLSVEEYALSHYRQQGYDEGIHGETSTFTTLYGLFFWDIIFLEGIQDVFRASFQAAPLDFNYDTFYEKRKSLIDKRLDQIRSSSIEDLLEELEEAWTKHNGRICSGVSWERFSSIEQAKQLVSCIGGKVLSGVFTLFAQDMRHWHSGMPDLVVWKSNDLQYRIVEVKGPGDRLSTKQQIWLSELASFGATVEVCYVTAIGGKRFRKQVPPDS